ncbi:MAG TPA: hypothetical protein VFR76_08250, partial [Verrucomicrobiae bacterium]|nr:hypothetical protein [Verrucomicrobiae bacterium]
NLMWVCTWMRQATRNEGRLVSLGNIEHPTSNIQHPTANQWPNWKPLVVRCWMLGVGCFPSVHGFNARIFRGILSTNVVAADVSPLHLKFEEVRADSRRLLRLKGSMLEIHFGEFSPVPKAVIRDHPYRVVVPRETA